MSWTDERVEQLKAMWIEGRSASQIAKALGGVTRNAVIGKVHRLGLSNRVGAKPETEAEVEVAPAVAETPAAAPEPEAEPDAPPAPAAAPAETASEPDASDAIPADPEIEAETAEAVEAPLAQGPRLATAVSEVSEEARRNLEAVEKKARRLNLLQLTERTCKWPIGDPATDDFYFCGLPAMPGKPYCEAHVAVAFQPMSARRDRIRVR